MHVAGTYFINNETTDYFPGHAWLLYLSWNSGLLSRGCLVIISFNEHLEGIKSPWFVNVFEWYTLNSIFSVETIIIFEVFKYDFQSYKRYAV